MLNECCCDEPFERTAGGCAACGPLCDIDSRELMHTARRMRDEGAFPSGRALESRPGLLIGAADTPVEPKPGWKPEGLRALYPR